MSKCGACGDPCRKTQIAHVADPEGGLTRKRVCNDCFAGALHIVTHVTHVTKGVGEKEIQRREAREIVQAAVKKLRGMAKAYKPQGQPKDAATEGRIDGLEQAADVLEGGEF